jgi:hypothetical protein
LIAQKIARATTVVTCINLLIEVYSLHAHSNH